MLLASASRAEPTPIEQGADAAAMSEAASDPCCDATGDGAVGGGDVILVGTAAQWGCTGAVGECSGDCTGDGIHGMPDLIGIQRDFGRTDCPTPP